MTLTTFSVAIAVAFIVLHDHLRKIFGDITSFMSAALEAGEDLFDQALSSLLTWLKKPGVPQPIDCFKVAVTVIFGLAAAYGDFIILRKTLIVVWPWEATAGTVAATLVLVGSLVAFIAHSQKSLPSKLGLIALALLFIGIEGMVAYVRTVEINRVEAVQSAFVDDAPSGGLSIENHLSDQNPTSAPTLRKALSDEPFSWMPLVASTIAVLVGTGLILAFWGALSVGGGAPLVWICACPLLMAFVTLRGTLMLVRRSKVIDAIATVLDALVDSSIQLWKAILAVRRFLSPEAFRSRRQASEVQTIRDWMKAAKLQAKKEIERVRLTSEVQEYRHDLPKILETVRAMRIDACVTARQRLIKLLEQSTSRAPEIDGTLDEAELFCGFQDKDLLPSKMQAIHGNRPDLSNHNGRGG